MELATASRLLLFAAPFGVADAWISHAPDAECSTSVTRRAATVSDAPTIVQSRALQETDVNPVATEAPGTGVESTCQCEPFQRSASGSMVAEPLPCVTLDGPMKLPTAVHAVGAVHDTPLNSALAAPAGVGVAWILHDEPLQRSARGDAPPAPVMELPTATHCVASAQDTAENPLPR
jgi:hypothetical protein